MMKNTQYSIKSDNIMIDRSDEGIVIIVDEKIYILGDLETKIWEKLEQHYSVDEIIEHFLLEYSEESKEMISKDIGSFVDDLLKSNLIYC